MKNILFVFLIVLSPRLYSQSKFDNTFFRNLTEVEGTDYVVTDLENWSKLKLNTRHLIFIDTRNGTTNKVELPNNGTFKKLEQIKIDSLGINKILLSTQTIDVDGKGIDWDDPTQIFILSTDGKQLTQLTDNKMHISSWVVNKKSGNVVVNGYLDNNANNKYDKGDKYEIHIFDLRTMKLISKI